MIKKPIRIVNVIGKMDIGGIETWMMQILKNSDKKV